MLINEPRVLANSHDQISAIIARLNGNSSTVKQLREGVYQRGDFGSSRFLYPEYEQYPDLGRHSCYGVCDDVDNLIAVMGDVLNDTARQFVVTMTPVRRDAQESDGGWRWHTWGEYIGKQAPQCEYLHDEPNIEQVFCFHIYERKLNDVSGAA